METVPPRWSPVRCRTGRGCSAAGRALSLATRHRAIVAAPLRRIDGLPKWWKSGWSGRRRCWAALLVPVAIAAAVAARPRAPLPVGAFDTSVGELDLDRFHTLSF